MLWQLLPTTLHLPLIGGFSALQQSGILAFLLAVSYFHKGARHLVLGLLLYVLGFKTIIPIIQFSYKVFKWVAMFGFYITYFNIGVEIFLAGVQRVLVFLEGLEHDINRRNQETR